MSYESDLATRYRSYAEVLRTIAGDDKLEETSRLLVGVAAQYEKMARTMDELDLVHQKRRENSHAKAMNHYFPVLMARFHRALQT
jgi:hypothetical protein